MICLTSSKFNMLATVLDYAPRADAVDAAIVGGHFEYVQDEDTGHMQQVWVEDTAVAPAFEDSGPKVAIARYDIPCYARGFTELGFRSTANTETFDNGVYRAVEVIQMNFPGTYSLARNQYITNIRGKDKRPLWLEEELGQPTIFEVQGVTPIFDAFGKHKENIAVLKRTVNQ